MKYLLLTTLLLAANSYAGSTFQDFEISSNKPVLFEQIINSTKGGKVCSQVNNYSFVKEEKLQVVYQVTCANSSEDWHVALPLASTLATQVVTCKQAKVLQKDVLCTQPK